MNSVPLTECLSHLKLDAVLTFTNLWYETKILTFQNWCACSKKLQGVKQTQNFKTEVHHLSLWWFVPKSKHQAIFTVPGPITFKMVRLMTALLRQKNNI